MQYLVYLVDEIKMILVSLSEHLEGFDLRCLVKWIQTARGRELTTEVSKGFLDNLVNAMHEDVKNRVGPLKKLSFIGKDFLIRSENYQPFLVNVHFRTGVSIKNLYETYQDSCENRYVSVININYIESRFLEMFGNMEIAAESSYSMRPYGLSVCCGDQEIIEEIKESGFTNPKDIWFNIIVQGRGEPGDLSTTTYNLFYMMFGSEVVVVCVIWDVDGWAIFCPMYNDPRGWPIGTKIFTR